MKNESFAKCSILGQNFSERVQENSSFSKDPKTLTSIANVSKNCLKSSDVHSKNSGLSEKKNKLLRKSEIKNHGKIVRGDQSLPELDKNRTDVAYSQIKRNHQSHDALASINKNSSGYYPPGSSVHNSRKIQTKIP